MGKKSDEYIDEVSDNIRTDRERLEGLYEQLLGICEGNPQVIASVGEPLVKIVDSLTKQNSQVIELAKIKQKSELMNKKPTGENELDEEEKEEAWSKFDARID